MLKKPSKSYPIWITIVQVISFFFLWHIASHLLNKTFFPSSVAVLQAFVKELFGKEWWQSVQNKSDFVTAWKVVINTKPNGRLLGDTIASSRRIFLGLGIATISATPLAILTAENDWLERLLSPPLYALYPVPKIVFLPIVVFFLGLGDPSIIFLIAFISFFQIYVIVHDNVANVPLQTLVSIRALGANRWQRLRHVYLPLSLPAILTGLKISVGTAIAVLFIAESLGNNNGLGYYINTLQLNRFAYDKVYAGILAISLLGMGLFYGLSWLERQASRWQK